MIKFTHNGKKYGVQFISAGMGSSDYRIFTMGTTDSMRISTARTYPKHGLERAALAAYRADMHYRMRGWAVKYGYKNVGAALKFCRS